MRMTMTATRLTPPPLAPHDALFLDDSLSATPGSGPRISGIETINAGAGNDVVDLEKRVAVGTGVVVLN
mgnify:CR=1 FL=1